MADQSIIARHVASVSSATASNIDFGTTVQKVYITTISNDVYIEFNGTANSDSFRVASGQPTVDFELLHSNVRTVSLLATTGTANVYVLGVVA